MNIDPSLKLELKETLKEKTIALKGKADNVQTPLDKRKNILQKPLEQVHSKVTSEKEAEEVMLKPRHTKIASNIIVEKLKQREDLSIEKTSTFAEQSQ